MLADGWKLQGVGVSIGIVTFSIVVLLHSEGFNDEFVFFDFFNKKLFLPTECFPFADSQHIF